MTYVGHPHARVLADSTTTDGQRVTTFEVTLHRFVLAELNTHRAFSRNSASSRAIPGYMQRERALNSPAMPLVWPSKQAGMQGGPDIPLDAGEFCATVWERAAIEAVHAAAELDAAGVHKSVTNRLLEPFLYQTVILTSGQPGLDNFFLQRCSDDAQPEIREPAELMLLAYADSSPRTLGAGEWHLPLVDIDAADSQCFIEHFERPVSRQELLDVKRKVSAARCARVSYLTHDGVRDIQADLDLYTRLTSAGHWSPLEHVATPRGPNPQRGNLPGWAQLRHVEERRR